MARICRAMPGQPVLFKDIEKVLGKYRECDTASVLLWSQTVQACRVQAQMEADSWMQHYIPLPQKWENCKKGDTGHWGQSLCMICWENMQIWNPKPATAGFHSEKVGEAASVDFQWIKAYQRREQSQSLSHQQAMRKSHPFPSSNDVALFLEGIELEIPPFGTFRMVLSWEGTSSNVDVASMIWLSDFAPRGVHLQRPSPGTPWFCCFPLRICSRWPRPPHAVEILAMSTAAQYHQ